MKFLKQKEKVWIESFIIIYMIAMVFNELVFIPDSFISICNVFFYAFAFFFSFYIIYQSFHNPQSEKKVLLLIFMFLGFYIISIIINKGDIFGNIKSFAITLIQLIITFYYLYSYHTDHIKSFIKRFCHIFIYMMLIITSIAFILYFLNIIVKFGYLRYNGLFKNANSAVFCVVAAFLSLYYLMNTNKRKAKLFYLFSIFIQFAFLPLAMSRGATILFYFSFTGLYLAHLFQQKPSIKKIVLCILLTLGTYALYQGFSYVVPKTQGILNIIKGDERNSIILDTSTDDKVQEELSKINVGKERNDYGGSNSIRLNMIKAGMHTFTKHPLFGVTSRNLADVVTQENPKLDLGSIEGAGLHNTYMQVLVSNGITGFMTIAVLTIYCIWEGIKNTQKDKSYLYYGAILISFMIYMNFSVSLFYFSNAMGIFYWISLACFTRNVKKCGIKEKKI